MGGVVAHLMTEEPALDGIRLVRGIRAIITLGSPLRHPAVIPDSVVPQVYERLRSRHAKVTSIASLSLAGGHRDILVRPDVAGGLITSQLEGMAVSADHQVLLWCRQLIHHIAQKLKQILKTST